MQNGIATTPFFVGTIIWLVGCGSGSDSRPLHQTADRSMGRDAIESRATADAVVVRVGGEFLSRLRWSGVAAFTQRFDERTSHVEPRFVTSAVEESILAFAQTVEQFEGTMLGSAGGGTAPQQVSNAAWWNETANKPEAQ
jgi:hypothetical protein